MVTKIKMGNGIPLLSTLLALITGDIYIYMNFFILLEDILNSMSSGELFEEK